MMKVVLDTSALIYLHDFSNFEEMITVSRVLAEAKDRNTVMKLAGLRIKAVEPSDEALEEVETVAKQTGDLEKLSLTDLDVLAAAKETGFTIISDDRNVQNVAEKMGIAYISLFNKKITKLISWQKLCPNCKKAFATGQCPVCGARLKRVPVSSEEINGKK